MLRSFTSASLVVVASVALAPAAASANASMAAQVDRFSMIFASDPQLTWWRSNSPAKGGECEHAEDKDACVDQHGRDSNSNLVTAMNAVTSLGVWPAGVAIGVGEPINPPHGAILNGDLTSYGHAHEWEDYSSIYSNLGYRIYPGLGNHDYENNVRKPDDDPDKGCVYKPLYHPDKYRCAKEAVWWMARQIAQVPGLVRHDAPGFVSVENAGGYNIRFTVDCDICPRTTTGTFELGQLRTVRIPRGAGPVSLVIEGYVWVDGIELEWKTLRTETIASPASACFKTSGTAFPGNQSTSTADCPDSAFPDGSKGSLAYSFDIGNYHFVQLQNWPGYRVNLPRVAAAIPFPTLDFPGRSAGFEVTDSHAWLKRDLQLATQEQKNIVLNMHNVGAALKTTEFADAIRNQNVVGIFAGHVHQNAGRIQTVDNGRRSDIPVILSGSAECGTFLYAEFGKRHYNVAVVDAASGTPSFLSPGWVCDTFAPYSSNSGNSHTLFTYDFNSAPKIDWIDWIDWTDPATPVQEGEEVWFRAWVFDRDGDTFDYTWDLGDGTTFSGRTVSGTIPTPLHTYADDGNYTVRLTVDDGYGGITTHSIDFDVAPAPSVTGDTIETGVVTITDAIVNPAIRPTRSP